MDYPYIVQTPGTCSGLPRIDGTRITVNLIVEEVVRLRMAPEGVVTAHPHLTMSQVHAALAYYYDHRDAVDASIKEAEQLEEELRARFPSKLAALRASLEQPQGS